MLEKIVEVDAPPLHFKQKRKKREYTNTLTMKRRLHSLFLVTKDRSNLNPAKTRDTIALNILAPAA